VRLEHRHFWMVTRHASEVLASGAAVDGRIDPLQTRHEVARPRVSRHGSEDRAAEADLSFSVSKHVHERGEGGNVVD
jgi:predicted GTPase